MSSVKDYVVRNFVRIDEHVSFSDDDTLILNLLSKLNINLNTHEARVKRTDIFTFYPVLNASKKDIDLIFIIYIGSKNDSGFITFYIWDLVESKYNLNPLLSSIVDMMPKFEKIAIMKSVSSEVLLFFKKSYNENIRIFLNKDNLYFERYTLN